MGRALRCSRSRLRRASLGIAGLLAWAGSGCAPDPAPPARTNAIVVVIDTLRADRLGSYGAERRASPHLDGLASESVRFERAYSAAPWTQPSVGAILTGLHPRRHRAPGRLHGVAPDVATLAETLNHRGWATGAVVSHHLLGRRFGFDRGFESFSEDEAGEPTHLSTGGVTRRSIAWLEERARESRPFLLFVHYFDPHYPYLRHPAIGFAAASEGRLDGTQPLPELRRLLPELTDAERAYIRDLYDEEIHYTDAGIGRLLEAVDDLGLRQQTVVIVTADHGEELGERGWIGHTRTLYEELLRVPLFVRAPGLAAGRVVDTPVSLVSLAPTLLDLLGARTQGDRFDAPSLVPHLEPEAREAPHEAETSTPVYASVDFVPLVADRLVKEAHKHAVVSGRYKLIRDDRSGIVELYDLEADPSEQRDLSAARPELVARLLPDLERHAAIPPRWSKRSAATVEPDDLERLRALGYAGEADDPMTTGP